MGYNASYGSSLTLPDTFLAQVLPPASDSINFVRFVDALRLVATKIRVSLNRVVEAIVLVGAPVEG